MIAQVKRLDGVNQRRDKVHAGKERAGFGPEDQERHHDGGARRHIPGVDHGVAAILREDAGKESGDQDARRGEQHGPP